MGPSKLIGNGTRHVSIGRVVAVLQEGAEAEAAASRKSQIDWYLL